MEKETKVLNIYQRMTAITTDLKTVAKNLTVELNKNNKYKAVGEVDVLNAVKPLEEAYGIYSYPFKREVIESKELTTKYETVNQFVRIETTYRFINSDNPQEYLDIISYGDGVDSQDKAVGKAMTYADKYALMKAYKISTGEDPDQNPSEEHIKLNAKPTLATKKQVEMIVSLLNDNEDHIKYTCETYKVDELSKLTMTQASEVISKIKAKQGK